MLSTIFDRISGNPNSQSLKGPASPKKKSGKKSLGSAGSSEVNANNLGNPLAHVPSAVSKKSKNSTESGLFAELREAPTRQRPSQDSGKYSQSTQQSKRSARKNNQANKQKQNQRDKVKDLTESVPVSEPEGSYPYEWKVHTKKKSTNSLTKREEIARKRRSVESRVSERVTIQHQKLSAQGVGIGYHEMEPTFLQSIKKKATKDKRAAKKEQKIWVAKKRSSEKSTGQSKRESGSTQTAERRARPFVLSNRSKQFDREEAQDRKKHLQSRRQDLISKVKQGQGLSKEWNAPWLKNSYGPKQGIWKFGQKQKYVYDVTYTATKKSAKQQSGKNAKGKGKGAAKGKGKGAAKGKGKGAAKGKGKGAKGAGKGAKGSNQKNNNAQPQAQGSQSTGKGKGGKGAGKGKGAKNAQTQNVNASQGSKGAGKGKGAKNAQTQNVNASQGSKGTGKGAQKNKNARPQTLNTPKNTKTVIKETKNQKIAPQSPQVANRRAKGAGKGAAQKNNNPQHQNVNVPQNSRGNGKGTGKGPAATNKNTQPQNANTAKNVKNVVKASKPQGQTKNPPASKWVKKE